MICRGFCARESWLFTALKWLLLSHNQLSHNSSRTHWCLTLSPRMTCFLWRWEASCITSVSRELYKCCDSTAMSPTACVVGHLMRFEEPDWHFVFTAEGAHTRSFQSCDVFAPLLHFVSIEQHHSSRDFPVDQPQSNGVAAVCGPCWVRSQPQRQRCARRPDGERVGCWSSREILYKSSLLNTPLSSGAGATVQRGDHGVAAEHPPKQDFVASPPCHTFQPAHWLRGPAAQTGVSWKSRLHSTYCHHQGQGKAQLVSELHRSQREQ